MSEADKMFEELGYEKPKNMLYRSNKINIVFDKVFEEIAIIQGSKVLFISKAELKAINKKCEELGWL